MEELKNKLNAIAKKEMEYADKNGSTTLSTCNYSGWDMGCVESQISNHQEDTREWVQCIRKCILGSDRYTDNKTNHTIAGCRTRHTSYYVK